MGLSAPALVRASPAPASPEPAGPVPAAAAIHDVRGHFAAFSCPNTIGDPAIRRGTVDISTQLGSVVTGWADIAGRSGGVAGTVSSTDEVNLVGLGGPDTFGIRGHITQPGDLAPCIFEGGYRGTAQDGRLVAIQQVPVTGAPSIGGTWAGIIGDPGIRQLAATFVQSRTGSLTGRVDARLSDAEFHFAIAGQAAWDGRAAIYLAVGGADGALATLDLRPGRAADPRTIVGTLRLVSADGTAQETHIELRPKG